MTQIKKKDTKTSQRRPGGKNIESKIDHQTRLNNSNTQHSFKNRQRKKHTKLKQEQQTPKKGHTTKGRNNVAIATTITSIQAFTFILKKPNKHNNNNEIYTL